MPTRSTEPIHEGDSRKPASPGEAPVESPSKDRFQGANGLPHHDSDAASSDQDIDTAGTDADDQSPTKAVGTGIADSESRG
jgi:hypothetical protein